MRIIALPLTLMLLVGCGEDERLTADPESIKADGTSSTTIEFRADLDDGSSVYFETDRGHFVDEDGYESQYATRSSSNGRAQVELFSGIQPGTATVTATTDYGSATVTVEFTPLSPSGVSLSFDCDVVNIGALEEPVPDIAVPCHLRMQDRDGSVVDPRGLASGDYGFLVEAGQLTPELHDDGYGNIHFLYTAPGGQTAPADVEPIDGEPSRAGDTGGTRNPRDGLVTIVAWVRGEEGFNDINSSGAYESEQGETFIDMGEPFIDVDDDGEFNAGAGERYEDVNGDGRYTPGNGSWDEDTVIWTTFKLLWSGPMHESPDTSFIEIQGGREIPQGQTREVVAYLRDRNMNPLAATDANSVTLTPGCYYCTYPSNYTFTMSNTRGFAIDDSGGIDGNLFEPPTFSITITNTNTYPDPEPFTVSLSGEVTPGPQTSDGYYPDNNPVSLELDATLLGVRE